MKKLMIALAVVAMAACSQAANVKWKLSENASPYKSGTWNVYSFVGDVVSDATTALSSKTAKDWTDFLGTADGTLSSARGSATGNTAGFAENQNTQYLTRILVDGDVADGSAYQILTAQDAGSYVYWGSMTPQQFIVDSIHDKVAVSGKFSAGGDVPEPTSGLLLLLGVAGLALRRRA